MAKRDKKKEKRQPPVVTAGYDERGKQREGRKEFFERESDAPDGVSGNWS